MAKKVAVTGAKFAKIAVNVPADSEDASTLHVTSQRTRALPSPAGTLPNVADTGKIRLGAALRIVAKK